jgi:hypothetical protein
MLQFTSAPRTPLLAPVVAIGLALAATAQLAAGQGQRREAPAPGAPPALDASTQQGSGQQAGFVHPAEKLDPETAIGRGWIEDMAEVMRRERENPSSTAPRKVRGDAQGWWAVPSRRSSFHAHSGDHYLINKWGDTRMGVDFPERVDFAGAWIAGHAADTLWADGVRFLGYRGEQLVETGAWLEELAFDAQWLVAGFQDVDRIEVEARAVYQGGGWFGLDDLTYTAEGAGELVIDFDDLGYNTRVTGSGYAGLVWRTGSGDFDVASQEVQTVHPPKTPDNVEEAGDDHMTWQAFLGGGGTAPTLAQDFNGPKIFDAGAGWLPPDTCGSVGPDHFVAVVNQNLSVYVKATGQRVVNTGLANFWSTGSSAGDPRAVYDEHSGRFIIVATDFNTRLWFAISLTSDATGSWYKSSVVLSQGVDSNRWPDYPTLGVDADGIYSASYMVGGSGQMSLFAIDKAPLLDGSPNIGTVTAWRNLPWEGAIQPAVTHGTPGREYCVSRQSSTRMRLRYVQGPLNNPSLVEAGWASIPSHSSPPNAPAMGSVAPLDCLDWRPMNAVYRNGSVWTAHGVAVSGRAACRWYEIDVNTVNAVQTGTVFDSTMWYMMPSISVNANSDVVVAFSGSNESQFAGAYFAGRVSSDPTDQLSAPVLYKSGNAAYNTVDSSGVNRWGDYSLTSVDPTDDETIWTIQEFTRSADQWGTRIAKLEFPTVCEDPTVYCGTSPNSVGSGATIGYFGTSSISANNLVLSCIGLVPNKPGLFYYGPNQTAVLLGEGVRCVDGNLTRLDVLVVDALGIANHVTDLSSPPFSSGPGAVTPGDKRNFQFWYRDTDGGTAGFNLSDGLEVTFCP